MNSQDPQSNLHNNLSERQSVVRVGSICTLSACLDVLLQHQFSGFPAGIILYAGLLSNTLNTKLPYLFAILPSIIIFIFGYHDGSIEIACTLVAGSVLSAWAARWIANNGELGLEIFADPIETVKYFLSSSITTLCLLPLPTALYLLSDPTIDFHFIREQTYNLILGGQCSVFFLAPFFTLARYKIAPQFHQDRKSEYGLSAAVYFIFTMSLIFINDDHYISFIAIVVLFGLNIWSGLRLRPFYCTLSNIVPLYILAITHLQVQKTEHLSIFVSSVMIGLTGLILASSHENLKAVIKLSANEINPKSNVKPTIHNQKDDDIDTNQQSIASQLSITFDTIPSAIYLKDIKGRYILVNKAFETLFNCSRADILYKYDHDIFPPQLADQLSQRDFRVLHQHMPEYVEEELQINGVKRSFIAVRTPISQGVSSRPVVCTVLNDVTETRANERDLRKSRARLSKAQQIANLGNWEWDFSSKKLWCSDEAVRIFEVNPDDLDGSIAPFIDKIHPDDRLAFQSMIKQALVNGYMDSFDHRIVLKNGTLRHVHHQGVLVTNSIGEPVRIEATVQDISRRKKTELSLKTSEQRYRALVDGASEAIFVINNTGQIIDANRGALTFHEATIDTLRLANFFDLTVGLDATTILNELNDLQDPNILSLEASHRKYDGGGIVPCAIRFVPYPSDKDRYYVATLYDLSQIRRAERERQTLQHQLFHSQKMDALGQLAGGLAHDFNNLLSPIILISEILIEEFAEQQFPRDQAGNILSAARRARRLVTKILEFTKPRTHSPDWIMFPEIVRDAGELLRSTIPSSIKVIVECDDDMPLLYADGDEIHQVVMNLGVNASQAIGNRPGHIKFNLSSKHIETGDKIGYYACLAVNDTGGGIPLPIREKMFEPFFTTKARTEGSGLGLAVIQRIVDTHNGFIELESVDNVGSTFYLYFPLEDEEDEGLDWEDAELADNVIDFKSTKESR